MTDHILKMETITPSVGIASGVTSIAVVSTAQHQSIINHQSPSQILDYFLQHGISNSIHDFWFMAPTSDWVVFFSIIISFIVLPNNINNLVKLIKNKNNKRKKGIT